MTEKSELWWVSVGGNYLGHAAVDPDWFKRLRRAARQVIYL